MFPVRAGDCKAVASTKPRWLADVMTTQTQTKKGPTGVGPFEFGCGGTLQL
jgi:hypothetical protein